jgi:hypothetical protein
MYLTMWTIEKATKLVLNYRLGKTHYFADISGITYKYQILELKASLFLLMCQCGNYLKGNTLNLCIYVFSYTVLFCKSLL